MSAAAETVRDFFERLAAAGSTPSSMGVQGTFLDSVEALLKERDDALQVIERALAEGRCDHAAEPCSWCSVAAEVVKKARAA